MYCIPSELCDTFALSRAMLAFVATDQLHVLFVGEAAQNVLDVVSIWVNLTGIFSKGPTIPKIGIFQITETIYNNLISTKPTDFYSLLLLL